MMLMFSEQRKRRDKWKRKQDGAGKRVATFSRAYILNELVEKKESRGIIQMRFFLFCRSTWRARA